MMVCSCMVAPQVISIAAVGHGCMYRVPSPSLGEWWTRCASDFQRTLAPERA